MRALGVINKNNSMSGVQWPSLNLSEVTVGDVQSIPRPVGYALPHTHSAMVQITSQNLTIDGFSDSESDLAPIKATSEALERLVMSVYAQSIGIPDTSNGWACHFSIDEAIKNALYELVERDVTLTAWENSNPFYIIPCELWPVQVREWSLAHRGSFEYSQIKVCLSQTVNGAAVSVFLFNDRRNCVVGHSSNFDLTDAIQSAFMECLRAGHSAILMEHFSEVMRLHQGDFAHIYSPGTHSVAYAYTASLPEEIRFIESQTSEIEAKWRIHQDLQLSRDLSEAEILGFKIMDRLVVRLRHRDFRDIYWGLAQNRGELKNKNPHVVG